MSAESLKLEGNAKHKEGRYAEAVELYSKAIELDPKCAALYSNRSASHLLLNKPNEALADAERCCDLKPEWEKGHYRKAAALESMGSLAEALPAYQAARDINPNNQEVNIKVQALKKRIKQENKQQAKAQKKEAPSGAGGRGYFSTITGGRSANIQQMSGPPHQPDPDSWARGLRPDKQAEWLVDCYRMRVDDDYAYGGCNLHGLYDPEYTKSSVCEDFLIFCKLAVEHKVVPGTWNWPKFLDTAAHLLPSAFEKEDAQDKWGSENVFSAMMGGRSLRFTGEVVYGSSIMGRGAKGVADSGDSDAADKYDELSEKIVGNWESLVSAGGSYDDVFADVGGVEVWSNLYNKMQLRHAPEY